MLQRYSHIFDGLPIMCVIVVGAMVIVFAAMCMDAVFGWHKAKERGEARTSYLFSRSLNKFLLYEGAMFIAGGIDTLIHFAWMQFTSSSHWAPVVSIFIGVTLCIVEIWSMREKADEKTRKNLANAVQQVAEILQQEKVSDLAKTLVEKQINSEKGDESSNILD